jgi:hypothetical protein
VDDEKGVSEIRGAYTVAIYPREGKEGKKSSGCAPLANFSLLIMRETSDTQVGRISANYSKNKQIKNVN